MKIVRSMKENRFRKFAHKHPYIINLSLVVAVSTVSLMAFELTFRIVLKHWYPKEANYIQNYMMNVGRDDSLIRFKPHPYLSYVRTDTVYEKNGIQIGNQLFEFEKPEGTIRIACLGGSTTMKKYPRFLESELEKRPNDYRFEIMDFGCEGWTSMESTINYINRVSDFSPDIVILHHGVNDAPPRIWPNYQPDYAHYRKSWNEGSSFLERKLSQYSWFMVFLLRKQGKFGFELQNLVIQRCEREKILNIMPLPETIEPFRRNVFHLITLVRSTGGEIILAPLPYNDEKCDKRLRIMIEENNQCKRELAEEFNVPIAATHHLLRRHTDWFVDNVHLNNQGQRLKSEIYSQVIWDVLLGSHKNGPSKKHVGISKNDVETN